jgi:hypothetical protein
MRVASVNRVRLLVRISRAALLAAPAACLAACSSRLPQPVTTGEGVAGPAPAAVVRPAQPPEPAASNENRDRQFEILNEAVSALRQEASRSYERASELAHDTERLRGTVDSLQRRLAKSRGDNRETLDHIQDLEKQLREVGTPPLDGVVNTAPSAPPSASPAPLGSPPPGTGEAGRAAGEDVGSTSP